MNSNEYSNETFIKIKENTNELELLIKCYEKTKSKNEKIIYLDEHSYRNHAGLFFSIELLKKINIIKLIYKKKYDPIWRSYESCEVSKNQ